MKKILLLNYEYPPLGGGGGVAARKLAEAWHSMGYDIDCITTWAVGLEKCETINGVTIHRVPVMGKRTQASAGMLSLLTFPICAYRLGKQLCTRNHYEFINTHFAVPTGPLGIWLSQKYSIHNILSLHGGDIYDPTKRFSPHRWYIFRKCISWVLNRSDVVIAQSGNTKDNTAAYYQYDKNKIKIIPLPYEKVVFPSISRCELGMEENSKYLISVGRLVRRKGYDFLLDVVSELPNVKLIIVGEGPEKENLQKKIEHLHVEKQVFLTGNISEERKFQYLANSDVYVLSSVHEGFGIVLQEAMQVGLPIVSTDFGGQVDLIKEGENGFLVKYGNKDMMVRAINQILSNDETAEKMRTANLKKIEEYNSQNIASSYLKHLNFSQFQ